MFYQHNQGGLQRAEFTVMNLHWAPKRHVDRQLAGCSGSGLFTVLTAQLGTDVTPHRLLIIASLAPAHDRLQETLPDIHPVPGSLQAHDLLTGPSAYLVKKKRRATR